MPARYLAELFTKDVLAAQERYTRRSWAGLDRKQGEQLGPDELEFVAQRDSFYLATVSSSGWPYLQHRGGPPGFLRATDPGTLVFPDFRGNKQMITTGNVASDDRVALLLMDYPTRTRLKILGHAHIVDARGDADLVTRVSPPELASKVERIVRIDVVGFDWNCPAFITQRFTAAEVDAAVQPLRRRIAELEAELIRQRSGRAERHHG